MSRRYGGKGMRISLAAMFGLSLLVTAQTGLAESSAEKAKQLASELGLELGGQTRLRGEVDARDFDSDTQPDEAVSSRVRLQVGVEPIEKIRAFVQVQDVRIWGEENNTLADSDADGFDLHQGYMVIDDLFGSGLQIQGGRQEVNFGEQRLVGAVDWTQNARSLDGILIKKEIDGIGWIQPFWFMIEEEDHIQGTIRQLNPNSDEARTDDQWFAGVHSAWNVDSIMTVEPHYYFLKDGGLDLELHTFGFYLHGASEIDSDLTLLYNTTFDYQTGDLDNDDIKNAFLAVGHLGLKISGVTVSGGYEYVSGDKEPNDTDYEAFNTLFATNHKFYGHMDYFLNMGPDLNDLGLQDIVAKVQAPVCDNTGLGADFHWFITAQEDINSDPNARWNGSNNLGQEVDLWLKHQYNAYLNFQAGYSFFVPGGAMRDRFKDYGTGRTGSKHASTSHWGYLMANLVF